MPRYDYKCSVCSGQIEFEKAINEDKYPVCCDQSMQRLWSAPAAIFNGSGFYSTDNRKQMYNKTMNSAIKDHPSVKPKQWILNAKDRCDTCSAQALVRVKGASGELMFCSHHYDKIMNNPESYKKMMSFMLEVVDEREKLVENRAIGAV